MLALAGIVPGCPIYDQDAGCFDDLDCAPGYLCDGVTGICYAEGQGALCNRPSDCDTDNNETCDRTGTCAIGDCHFPSVGCVQGYVCSSESGRWQCVSEDAGQGGGDAGGAASVSGGAPGAGGAPGGGAPTASGGEPAQTGGNGNLGDAGGPASSAGQAGAG